MLHFEEIMSTLVNHYLGARSITAIMYGKHLVTQLRLIDNSFTVFEMVP